MTRLLWGRPIYERITYLISVVATALIIFVINAVLTINKPVMGYVKPVGDWVIEYDYIQVQLTGKKARNCRRVPDSEVGYIYSDDGFIAEVSFKYIDDETPLSSFPPGVINIGWTHWGLWRGAGAGRVLYNYYEVDEVGYSITHLCDGKTKVSHYKFKVPRD